MNNQHAEHMAHDGHVGHKSGEAAHAGHDHHAMMEKDFRKRFFFVTILTLPVLTLSPTVQSWLGFRATFPGSRYLLFILATLITIYGTWPFYKGAMKALKSGVLDMSVLVSIAVTAGYLFSVGTTFAFQAVDFYWEISTLVAVLLLGHWLEMRAVRGTSGALRELLKLIPSTAHRLNGDEVEDVSTSALAVGDLILVRPGEQAPVDGEIVEGESSLNEAMVTGESNPVSKQAGDQVIGGTINGEGALKVRATKVGEDTALAQIVRLVREAQASKPPIQRLADRAAHWLTIIAVGAGLATFLFWFFPGNQPFVFALTLSITVLVIACPHALGLAIPVVTTISTTLGAKNGMLVRNAHAVEVARKITTVVFDKTGTLTRGEFGVTEVIPLADESEDEILARIAAVERDSEHTIAQGIVRSAVERGLNLPAVTGVQAIPGKGVQGEIDGKQVYVGNRALMEQIGVALPEDPRLIALEEEGKTLVFAASKRIMGAIALADLIRDESRAAVAELKSAGIQVAMLTGDSRPVAEWVGRELGLDLVFPEVKPGEKALKVKQLQEAGQIVAMVGDGINDAPALVQANVGMAIGAGTNVAIESADVVLVKNDPRDVARLIRLSQATMRKMRQNLVWATGYNAIAIPAAAGIFQPFGFVLEPQWGALIMAASTVIVAINAISLRRVRLSTVAA
ncbi:MAG: cadmium-translocating P-type ATPase [Nitrospiraceae bacterium]|nr:cadmium-translocating P-type ATPase [Nitrospiraceae bacterium]